MNLVNYLNVNSCNNFEFFCRPIRKIANFIPERLSIKIGIQAQKILLGCAIGYCAYQLYQKLWRSAEDQTMLQSNLRAPEVIFAGTQLDCNGKVDLTQAEEIRKELNKNCEGVDFDSKFLLSNLNGGTCSAMSFDFLKQYFIIKNKMGANSAERIFHSIKPKYQTSSLEFRTVQAALNTISKNPNHSVPDFKMAKIAAMLSLYGLRVSDVIGETDLIESDCQNSIKRLLQRVNDQACVIRMIQPINNHKEEFHGHTMILIRECNKTYLYDPNDGVLKLRNAHEWEDLYNSFKKTDNHSHVPSIRFYRTEVSIQRTSLR